MISPVKYSLHVNINKPTNIIFSENYNSSWIAEVNGKKILSTRTKDNLNVFALTKKGDYVVGIYFKQDIYYKIGIVVSGIFLLVILYMIKLKNYEK